MIYWSKVCLLINVGQLPNQNSFHLRAFSTIRAWSLTHTQQCHYPHGFPHHPHTALSHNWAILLQTPTPHYPPTLPTHQLEHITLTLRMDRSHMWRYQHYWKLNQLRVLSLHPNKLTGNIPNEFRSLVFFGKKYTCRIICWVASFLLPNNSMI